MTRGRVRNVRPAPLDEGSPIGFEKLKDLWGLFKNFANEARILTDYLVNTDGYGDGEADRFYQDHPQEKPRQQREQRGGVGGA